MPGRLLRAAALACLLPASGLADVVAGECEWLADMRNVAEPWEENSRTFYRGQVRVVLVDSIEPACCYLHLILLVPDKDAPNGGRRCVAVNQGGGAGFAMLDFKALRAGYDPATGLVLTFPYALFDPERSTMGPEQEATVQVNLATGRVQAR